MRLLACLFIFVTLSFGQKKYEANWESLDSRPTPAWFTGAKFGIFIHWGVYSVPSFAPVHVKGETQYSEWYWNSLTKGRAGKGNATSQFHIKNYGPSFDYFQFVPMFRAELFDPEHWADVFVRSGARYVVPTSKHHDGFAIWPSADASRTWGRPWNAVEAGPKRDLLGELTDAVRRKGIRMGFYYSLYEWYNPLWLKDHKQYAVEHMHPQFKDVVTRYKPAIIFSDGEWEMPSADWKSPELLAWLYNESPVRDEVIVNDRWGKETRHHHGGYYTTEYGSGMPGATHPWEENRGMGYSYGYNRMETVDDYRTTRELILILADMVSRGGNLLLDIGPTADGRIPTIMEERLVQMGDWLRTNGEAIYETRPWHSDKQWSSGEQPQVKYGEFMTGYDVMKLVGKPANNKAVIEAFFTSKGNDVYAILPNWPGKTLALKGLAPSSGTVVTMLGSKAPVHYRAANGGLMIDMPDFPAESQPAYTLKMTNVR